MTIEKQNQMLVEEGFLTIEPIPTAQDIINEIA